MTSECFNCNLPSNVCFQGAECNQNDGRCICPVGFGGDDCIQPLCGALSDGAAANRPPRQGDQCECKEGWTGINCNVCTNDRACDALMPTSDVEGTCYTGGMVVKENFHMCDVTNKGILDILNGDIPQVTFTCNANSTCAFQLWVNQEEGFYCNLDECNYEQNFLQHDNETKYECDSITCGCIPGRMLCGKDGGIDLSEYLRDSIQGPGKIICSAAQDQCRFSEPQMDDLIQKVFGDDHIFLKCDTGECLHYSELPGFTPPVNEIDKSSIVTGLIASFLFLSIVIGFIVWCARRSSRGALYNKIVPDDEATKLMSDHAPATLTFENVTYKVGRRQILNGINGIVKPGEVMAIMGGSGAGKTTFLDILARKNKSGIVRGDILVNGRKVSNTQFKNVIGYVDQEDTLMATLTVYETILYSALLRLPKDMSFEAKNFRVIETMNELGIVKIKDSLIGQPGQRGISGGEKRRVSIACELVTSPSILFLDEPTSGLDSFNAYNVVECLISLARNYKRTVIFTIHQPRSNIVALFDHLVLLAEGKTVYSGALNLCQNYFESIGHPCPKGFNIADYLVDLTMGATRTRNEIFMTEDEMETMQLLNERAERKRRTLDLLDEERPGNSRTETSGTVKTVKDNKTANTNGHNTHVLGDDDDMSDTHSEVVRREWASLDGGRPQIGSESSTTSKLRRSQAQQNAKLNDIAPDPETTIDVIALDSLTGSYASSSVASKITQEIQEVIADAEGLSNSLKHKLAAYKRQSLLGQFFILSRRTFKNLYRNPMLMLAHYLVSIFLGFVCGFLFYNITSDISGFQNRIGLFFFLLALFGFSTLTSLNVFAGERILFVRERANGYYHPITYFASKVVLDIVPLRVIPPIIMGMILYPMVGLVSGKHQFPKFILVITLFNLTAAAICLFIGIVFKETSVANLVGSLVMLFSLLFAGLLLNHDTIPDSAVWLQKLSIFHYGFEALAINEVLDISLSEKKYGLSIDVPGPTILTAFGFDVKAFWPDITGLIVIFIVFLTLSYTALHVLLVEKR